MAPMRTLRLLVSDIDGTLVRSDKTLSDETVAAVRRLEDASVPVSLISARPPSGMLWIAERLGLTVPIAAFNGGTLVRPDGTILSAAHLPAEASRQALALIDRPDVINWVFAGGQWYTDRIDDHYTPRERTASNQEPALCSDFTCLVGEIDKIVAVSSDHDMLTVLERDVADALGMAASVARSQPYYLDVTARIANKGDGIAALAKAIGAPISSTAVIGDQYNDLPMFDPAGLSIAMAQGPEEVRKAATHCTESNDEDGVAQAIDHILMPLVSR